ncbi:MAG: replication-relaxation family protein [Solirubrobacteraceae bacterium]
MHLHSRDVQVLELLADRRVETLAVLQEKLWPGCARKSAYNRLGQLARAGYLEHLVRPDPVPRPSAHRRPSQHLYILGPKAPTAMRIRNRDTRKLAARRMPAAYIDHQLATNRVGDWLGTRLLGEMEVSAGQDSRFRADAGYRAAQEVSGRDLVLVEVDLGHYSRTRILAKIEGFKQHPQARGVLFACPTDERAKNVSAWISERYGTGFMRRCQVFSFRELQNHPRLEPGTTPRLAPPENIDWYEQIMGPAGCQ